MPGLSPFGDHLNRRPARHLLCLPGETRLGHKREGVSSLEVYQTSVWSTLVHDPLDTDSDGQVDALRFGCAIEDFDMGRPSSRHLVLQRSTLVRLNLTPSAV